MMLLLLLLLLLLLCVHILSEQCETACSGCRNCEGVKCQGSDPTHVYRCNLGGLPDLDTGCEHVQDTIAGFFSYLLDLGVAGVRIDAAKHINPAELSAILRKVSWKHRMYVFSYDSLNNLGQI
jgi:glycosidase